MAYLLSYVCVFTIANWCFFHARSSESFERCNLLCHSGLFVCSCRSSIPNLVWFHSQSFELFTMLPLQIASLRIWKAFFFESPNSVLPYFCPGINIPSQHICWNLWAIRAFITLWNSPPSKVPPYFCYPPGVITGVAIANLRPGAIGRLNAACLSCSLRVHKQNFRLNILKYLLWLSELDSLHSAFPIT